MITKKYVLMALVVFVPALVSARTIQSNQYMVWGIGDDQIAIPAGSVITEAVLTIQNVSPQVAPLYIHLLDNIETRILIGINENSGDFFNSCGALLSGSYVDGNYICRFSQNENAQSPIRSTFAYPTSVTLANSATVQLSSALLELMDYAGNGRGLGIGIDSAQNASFTFSSLKLELTVSSYQGQPAEQILTYTSTQSQYALEFDGNDDYVEIGDLRSYTSYTLSAWVRPQSSDAQSIMLSTDGGGIASSHQLRINASGQFEHYLYDWVTARTVTSTTTVVPGTWYHIVGVADQNGYMRLYVNGVEEGTAVHICTPWVGGIRWWIGKATAPQAGNYGYFEGTIKDVQIWSTALTAQEVLSDTEGNPVGVESAGDWKLDECTGTMARDSSGNGCDGTIWGAMSLPVNTDLQFDGVDDYIEISDARSYTTYTLSAWVKPQSYGAQSIMLSTDDGGIASSHQLRINASGQFEHYLYDWVTARTVTGTTTIVPGTWYYVTGVADQNGYMRLYVNGVEEGTAIDICTPWAGGSRWWIGKANYYPYFEGAIKAVQIWNRALTAQEVLVSMDADPVEVRPVGYWKLDECAGTTARESSGNGNDGTILGARWVSVNSDLQFDGVDDYIEIADSRSYTTYTVSAWVNLQGTGAQNIITMTNDGGIASSHQLRINASGQVEHYLYDWVTARTVRGTTMLVPGTWYHITGVAAQNGYMRLYVNGIEEGTAVNICTPWSGGTRWWVGKATAPQAGNYGYFKGSIKAVQRLNRALTSQEVLASVESGS